jgi:hypothetical protein
MRVILMSLAFCLAATPGFSQSKKFSFTVGEEYEVPKGAEDVGFYGSEQTGLVNLFVTKKKKLLIRRFNPKNVAAMGEAEIEKQEMTKNYTSEGVIQLGNRYFWLHSDWDKSNETEKLFYDEIDVTKGTIIKEDQLLVSTTRLAGEYVSTGWYRAKVVGKYEYNLSADKSKLLISYRHTPKEKNDKKSFDNIGYAMFDQNMNKIWSGDFDMPYTEQIMDNLDYSVDKNGNAYLLAKVYDNEKRKEVDKETGLPGYHFEALKFSGEQKMTQTKISLDQYFIRQASIIENSNGDMVVACTYSKSRKSRGTDGVYLAMISSEGKLTTYRDGFYEFPLEELEKFESKRARKKMEKSDDYEAPFVLVRNILSAPDGSLFIACEQYHMEQVTTYSRYGSRTDYYYYFEDIIATRINANGKVDWVRKIPKMQKGVNRYATLGFKLVADETGYYFLYLDNKKNLELEEDEAPKYHQDGYGGQVSLARLDPSGNLTREIIFDAREEKLMLYPRRFSSFDQTRLVGRADIKGPGAFAPILITIK